MSEQTKTSNPTIILGGVRHELTPPPCGVSEKFRKRIASVRLAEATIEGTWDPYEQVKEDGTQP